MSIGEDFKNPLNQSTLKPGNIKLFSISTFLITFSLKNPFFKKYIIKYQQGINNILDGGIDPVSVNIMDFCN